MDFFDLEENQKFIFEAHILEGRRIVYKFMGWRGRVNRRGDFAQEFPQNNNVHPPQRNLRVVLV